MEGDRSSGSSYPMRSDSRDNDGARSKAGTLPLRILLVEDNPADVLVTKEVLKQFGIPFELQTASDGAEAISLLELYETNLTEVRPGLVLLDLNLPKISGAEVLSHLREHEWSKRIPVVIVTSSDSPSDMNAIRKIGATAYFRKPTSLAAYMQLGRVILDVLPNVGNEA
jgi:CheY-like chemotaxis protein